MGALSDYMEDKILSWLKGTSMPAAPATVYVGLFSANPGDTGSAGSPSDGTETSGTSYARVAVTTASDWSAISTSSTARQISNSGTISFPTPGAGGWSGPITGIGIWDASSAGNLLFWCAQSPTKTINQGDTVSIAGGALVVSMD